MAKLTEKNFEVCNYVKENGGRVSMPELVDALGRNMRSISANVTSLVKHGLVTKEEVEVEDADKPIKYVVLTDEGKAFVNADDDE